MNNVAVVMLVAPESLGMQAFHPASKVLGAEVSAQ